MPRKDVYNHDSRRGGVIIPQSDGFRMEQSTPQGGVLYEDESKDLS